MNAMTKTEQPVTGLALLRQPFKPNQISKLPKPTKAQTDAVRADFKKGIRCKECGAWHHPQVVHLDYVGHAALTDRLLDADPAWNWEPLNVDANGIPTLDQNCGMWIRLTVCGQTRLGYGHAEGKRGGDAIKEVIGDALRNAAMRFGAALDLWHKGELHADEAEAVAEEPKAPPLREEPRRSPVRETGPAQDAIALACDAIRNAATLDQLTARYQGFAETIRKHPDVKAVTNKRKADLESCDDAEAAPIIPDDGIPDFAYEGHGRA